ncbi:MAG TPA: hypothetical protein VJB57_14835 [Dehalococcoidia bacterium]|nr:hypothetical protein [Dehalococcoidia bacterium]
MTTVLSGEAVEGHKLLDRVILGRRWLLAVAALIGVPVLVAAGYWGERNYPDYSQPTGARAEERIAAVFGVPKEADPNLVGDIMIERFYAVDPATGKRYVADMAKGRVTQLVETQLPDSVVVYSVLLDRRGLQASKIQALMTAVDNLEQDVTYLGVQMQGGETETFNVNYSGRLARSRASFRGPHGESLFPFLKRFPSPDIGLSGRVYTNKDNNHVLSSTRVYPYFTTLFGLKDAVFLSKLVFLDATSTQAISLLSN